MKKAIETIDLAKLTNVLGGCGGTSQQPRPSGDPQGGMQQRQQPKPNPAQGG